MTSLDAVNDDFRDTLREFLASGVEFPIVGAYALAFHGVPRATGDIDLLVRPTAENARRILEALERFGSPIRAAGVDESDFSRPGAVYQVGMPPRRIDLLTEISGVDIDTAWASRVTAVFDEGSVPVIGREALIRNKRATGRAKDLADIQSLES